MSLHGDEQLKPCGIYVDADGEWYHGENRIFRPEILELLYQKIEVAPGGQYALVDTNGKCLIEVADTPFIVSRVDLEKSETEEKVILGLKHIAKREILDPGTLSVGEDNVMYCRILDGRFKARFSRPAYYQIAELIEEAPTGEFLVMINGIGYPVSVE